MISRFAYVPYNTPHSPMQVPDRWWKKFKDKNLDEMMRHRTPSREDRLHLLAAFAMCENIDWNVGRVLKKLGTMKVADDTIVVFFHDNGPNGSRWNGDMEGRKGSTEEGGTRSPLLIRWPNGDQARHESVTYCIGSGFIANTYGNGRSIRKAEKEIGWKKPYLAC